MEIDQPHGGAPLSLNVSEEMRSLATASKLILFVLWFTVIPTFSVPLPPTKKATIKGTVVDWLWRNEIQYQEATEGLAHFQTIPAHYIIRLKIQKKRNETFNTINWYSRTIIIGIGINSNEFKEDEVILYLPSPKLEGLKVDAKLTLEDYSIAADDLGPSAGSSKILINGATPKVVGPVFPVEKKKDANK